MEILIYPYQSDFAFRNNWRNIFLHPVLRFLKTVKLLKILIRLSRILTAENLVLEHRTYLNSKIIQIQSVLALRVMYLNFAETHIISRHRRGGHLAVILSWIASVIMLCCVKSGKASEEPSSVEVSWYARCQDFKTTSDLSDTSLKVETPRFNFWVFPKFPKSVCEGEIKIISRLELPAGGKRNSRNLRKIKPMYTVNSRRRGKRFHSEDKAKCV